MKVRKLKEEWSNGRTCNVWVWINGEANAVWLKLRFGKY